MEEIKIRLAAAGEATQLAYDQRAKPGAHLHAEFAILQIRQTTELLALAVLVAHNEGKEFRSNRLVKAWNADAIFDRLERLNKDAFPAAFVQEGEIVDGYANVLIQEEGYLDKAGLTKIYHDCGRRLHAGSLRDFVGQARRYDLGVIQGWRKGIIQLLNNHIFLLHGREKTMICHMATLPDGGVTCHLSPLIKGDLTGPPGQRQRSYRSEYRGPSPDEAANS